MAEDCEYEQNNIFTCVGGVEGWLFENNWIRIKDLNVWIYEIFYVRFRVLTFWIDQNPSALCPDVLRVIFGAGLCFCFHTILGLWHPREF